MDEMKRLVRLSEAAELLGVTPQTLRRWDREGKLRTVRTVGGHRVVPLEEIERLRGEPEPEKKNGNGAVIPPSRSDDVIQPIVDRPGEGEVPDE